MTKLIKWLSRENVGVWFRGVMTAIAVSTTIAMLGSAISAFTKLGSGSRDGTNARQHNIIQDERIENIEECEVTQRLINITIQHDVDVLKETVFRIDQKTEKIYELLITQRR